MFLDIGTYSYLSLFLVAIMLLLSSSSLAFDKFLFILILSQIHRSFSTPLIIIPAALIIFSGYVNISNMIIC